MRSGTRAFLSLRASVVVAERAAFRLGWRWESVTKEQRKYHREAEGERFLFYPERGTSEKILNDRTRHL